MNFFRKIRIWWMNQQTKCILHQYANLCMKIQDKLRDATKEKLLLKIDAMHEKRDAYALKYNLKPHPNWKEIMIRNHLQLAHIQIKGLDLFIGNYDACNRGEFPADCNQLHIWHDAQPGICYKQATQPINSICMEYKEHDLLTNEQIEQVCTLARSGKPLFIHCAAGLGRSPTIAVLALTACGIEPWLAMSLIAEGMWKQYTIPHCPSYDCKVLNQIFSFYDSQVNNGKF